jgi:hypothetical protein
LEKGINMAKKPVKKTKKKAARKLTDSDILAAFDRVSNAIAALSRQINNDEDTETETETDVAVEPVAEVEEASEEPVVMVRRPDGKLVPKTQMDKPASVKTTKLASVNEIKARYELWAYDEYNQGSIINSGPKLDKIINAAKRYVTEQNLDNALAAGEKDKVWEAYLPQVFVDGEESTDVLYAGNKRDGKHYVYVRNNGKWELRRPDSSVQFRFFLGTNSNGRSRSDWYLADHKGRGVTSLADRSLENKTVLFVKIV